MHYTDKEVQTIRKTAVAVKRKAAKKAQEKAEKKKVRPLEDYSDDELTDMLFG